MIQNLNPKKFGLLKKFSTSNPDLVKLIDVNTGFYEKNLFNLRLKEERRRSDRTGLPLSMIVLDISKTLDSMGKNRNSKVEEIKDNITKIIVANTREIDIKAWYEDHSLRLLLTATPIEGARCVIKKIKEKINTNLMLPLTVTNNLIIEPTISITSYPETVQNSSSITEVAS